MRAINPLSGSPTAEDERRRARNAIAANVRVELARANVSGAQMAAKLGLATSTWSRRMAGDVSFDGEELAAVATILDISTSVLTESSIQLADDLSVSA
jgi:transcriptional regulator with XRE-family HTH domain